MKNIELLKSLYISFITIKNIYIKIIKTLVKIVQEQYYFKKYLRMTITLL